jgi:Delta7-sterol 5-desaturase
MGLAALIPLAQWFLFQRTPGFLRPYQITSAAHVARVGRTEYLYNVTTFAVIFAYGAIIYELYTRGWTRLMVSDGANGFWIAAEFLLLNLLQDTHFYWTHRALHQFRFLTRAHSVHHRATQPSPWTTFTFHPIEAALNFSFFLLVAVALPLHWQSVALYFVFLIVLNVNGHLGFEIFPRTLFQLPIVKTFNNATHHQIHHSKSNCNFGLYYEFWDRWMRTEHADYRPAFLRNAAGSKADT